MSKYQHVNYGEVIKTLCKIQRNKGAPIPLTQTVNIIEQQKGVMLDRARILRALTLLGKAGQARVEYKDSKGDTVLKIIDYIV